MHDVRVQSAPFDVAHELARLDALGGGAVASFTGLVRGGDGLVELRLDHHPGMTGAMLTEIAAEAGARWPLLGLILIHRHGPLVPGDRIVLAATAAAHRAAALASCAFLIDWAKTKAPFWKRETFADGTVRWVEAKPADDAAAAGW